jgi:hypothetical protein
VTVCYTDIWCFNMHIQSNSYYRTSPVFLYITTRLSDIVLSIALMFFFLNPLRRNSLNGTSTMLKAYYLPGEWLACISELKRCQLQPRYWQGHLHWTGFEQVAAQCDVP